MQVTRPRSNSLFAFSMAETAVMSAVVSFLKIVFLCLRSIAAGMEDEVIPIGAAESQASDQHWQTITLKGIIDFVEKESLVALIEDLSTELHETPSQAPDDMTGAGNEPEGIESNKVADASMEDISDTAALNEVICDVSQSDKTAEQDLICHEEMTPYKAYMNCQYYPRAHLAPGMALTHEEAKSFLLDVLAGHSTVGLTIIFNSSENEYMVKMAIYVLRALSIAYGHIDANNEEIKKLIRELQAQRGLQNSPIGVYNDMIIVEEGKGEEAQIDFDRLRGCKETAV